MPNSSCENYYKKIEDLKGLYNQFQGELKTFKTSRDSKELKETRNNIQEIIKFFEDEGIPEVKPFSEEELKNYEKDNWRRIVINENITQEEIARFSQTPDIDVELTNIPQELKNKIKEWKGCITDFSLEFDYPNLQSVGGYLNAENNTTFQAKSLQSVGTSLFSRNVTTFQAPNLKEVEKIYLSRRRIKEGYIILPEETKKKIEWE